MKPRKDQNFVSIPMTVDVRQRGHMGLEQKKFILVVSVVAYLLIAIFSLVVMPSKLLTIGVLLFILIIAQFVIRIVVMSERRYKKALKALEESKNQMGYDVFWDILSVEQFYPYTVQFRNGVVGYYMLLEKGSTVGKGDNADYYHHEAAADALKYLSEKGISYIHLDISELASRDSRIPIMREELTPSDNEDLFIFNLKQIEYLEWYMEGTVATSDIILCYSRDDAGALFTNIEAFSNEIKNANYARISMLDKEQIVGFAKEFLNLDEFDINVVDEVIANKASSTNFLTPIYTETDGVRTVLNKTTREKMTAKEIIKQEKQLRKINRKAQREMKARQRKGLDDDTFESFENTFKVEEETKKPEVVVEVSEDMDDFYDEK